MSASSLKKRLEFRSSMIENGDSMFSSQLNRSKMRGLRGPRINEFSVNNALSKKILEGTSGSALKLRTYESHGSMVIKPIKQSKIRSHTSVFSANFPVIEKCPTQIDQLEQDLTERINNLDSNGPEYITEAYELSKRAFQKIIDLDRGYGKILKIIKKNYEKYHEITLSDLPTSKNSKEYSKSPIKVPFTENTNKNKFRCRPPPKKLEIPNLLVPETNSIMEFQQEFLSHFDEFSTSWRNHLESHKTGY